MLLGSQYCVSLLAIVKKEFPTVYNRLWTDSEIALSSNHKLKQFIKNQSQCN